MQYAGLLVGETRERRYRTTRLGLFSRLDGRKRSVLLRLLAALLIGPAAALANPTGGVVASGAASMATAGNTLNVTQTTDRAVINWNTFSIASGETTRFIQPSATSAVLNRVTGNALSSIIGTLSANGQVYLINQNGIVFGGGSVVNTAGFLASTLNVADSAFMAGGDLHFAGNSTATIVNSGSLSVTGGDLFLIAQQVQNQGTLSAPNGTVGLAGGTQVLVKASGAEKLFIEAGSGGGSVSNTPTGQIAAATAELKAAGGNEYALAVNNGGVIRATGTASVHGHVYLTATGGTIVNSGTIAAKNADGTGGAITAQAVAFTNQGTVNASGTTGGTVSIASGDITLDNGSLIDARGTNGAGGSVLLTSTDGEFIGTTGSSVLASGTTAGGSILVGLDPDSDMIFSGTLDASSSGGHGGTVAVTGGGIVLASARLLAGGATGGGTIEVGGGSGGAPVAGLEAFGNSASVFVDSNSVLDAAAQGNGNGGHVVLWSDGTTQFSGAISVAGGPAGGDGGLAEVSGAEGVGIWGTVDRSAPHGAVGTLLLDPRNITITTASSTVSAVQTLLAVTGTTAPSSTSDSENGDHFGAAVALSQDGSIALIGAWGKTVAGAAGAGAAYLFDNGAINAKLTDPNAAAGNNFGSAVALSSNGLTALVSAPGTASSTGAAYIFSGTGYTTTATLSNPNGSPNSDAFGGSVALSGDGTKALIGAASFNDNQGAAYLFTGSGASYSNTVTFTDPGTGSDGFGGAVALSRDGSTALIGAGGAGAAYFYADSGADSGVALTDPHSGTGEFGAAVALSYDGSIAVVGSGGLFIDGEAYVFSGTNHAVVAVLSSPTPSLSAQFGNAVSVSDDGSKVLVGDSDAFNSAGTADTGAAYLFSGSGSTYTLSASMADPGNASGDSFGQAVALSGDKSTALIGASSTFASPGAAYLYGSGDNFASPTTLTAVTGSGGSTSPNVSSYTTGATTADAASGDEFGASVALSSNGSIALIGAPDKTVGGHADSGAAYVFVNGAISAKFSDPGNAANDRFGYSVALSSTDGSTALVGAYGTSNGAGAAYVFSGASYGTVATLSDPGNAAGDDFGISVALSADGARELIGAYEANGSQGAAYVFSGSALTATLSDPGNAAGDLFGYSVALSADKSTALVGAFNASNSRGAAYVFSGTSYGTVTTLSDPGNVAGDGFGNSVALSNNGATALVGALYSNHFKGVAYVFNGSTLAATLNDPGNEADDYFGNSVALSGDGLTALVGAARTSGNRGAAYIYSETNYGTMTTLNDPGSAVNVQFGSAVALSSDGKTALVGASGASNNAGAAYLYTHVDQLITSGNPGGVAAGTDLALSPTQLAALLAGGNVVLQANNNILLDTASALSWTGGNSLTLKAGQSITLDSNVTTGNGSLTLVANDTAADGITDADRLSGTAVLDTSASAINAGTGAVSLTLDTGAGNTNHASGDLTLGAITAGSVTAVNKGAGNVVLTSGKVVTASGTGTAITLAAAGGGNFVNNAGANALAAAHGRWLVYSADPASDTFGGLASGSQAVWNATYGTTTPPASGNRYLFTTQPTLTVDSANVTKTYGTTDALTALADLNVTGFVNAATYGNVFTQDTAANSLTGTAALTSTGAVSTANVAGGPYGIAIAQGSLAGSTGYALAMASSPTGQLTVDPATLTITANSVTYTFGDTFTLSGYTVAGLAGSDTVSGLTLSSPGTDPNLAAPTSATNYAITISGGTLTASDPANYNSVFSYVPGTLTLNPPVNLPATQALNQGTTATQDAGVYYIQNGTPTYVQKSPESPNGYSAGGTTTESSTTTSYDSGETTLSGSSSTTSSSSGNKTKKDKKTKSGGGGQRINTHTSGESAISTT